jgi:hypothetical protein
MAAEFREWRETQALEKAIHDKTIDEKKWEEEQLTQAPEFADEDLPKEAVG